MKIPFYYDQVYDVVGMIPPGRVTTYGHIADYLALGSARMVGYALRNATNMCQDLPAHRVVNHKGDLSGRANFEPPQRMQELLEQEGILIENDKVTHFKKLLWVPSHHL